MSFRGRGIALRIKGGIQCRGDNGVFLKEWGHRGPPLLCDGRAGVPAGHSEPLLRLGTGTDTRS